MLNIIEREDSRMRGIRRAVGRTITPVALATVGVLTAGTFVGQAAADTSGAREVDFTNCGDSGRITAATLLPVANDEGLPQLKKGTMAEWHLTWVPGHDATSARGDSTITVLGINVPIPGVERDFMKITDGPVDAEGLKKGEEYKSLLTMPVSSIAPVSKTTFTLKVHDGDGNQLVCGKTRIAFV